MSHPDDAEPERFAFAEFAHACRVERDRIACARLAAEDRRFETSLAERAVAEMLASRLIASVTR